MAMEPEPPKLSPGSMPGIAHWSPPETFQMNKYHFLLVLERMRKQERRFRPRGEWSLVPLSIFVTTMQSLLTSQFKDAMGLDAASWHQMTVQTAKFTAASTLVLFVWWVVDKCVRRDKSPEQMVEDVIREMERDRQRAMVHSQPEPTS